MIGLAGTPFATTVVGAVLLPSIAAILVAAVLGGARIASKMYTQNADIARQVEAVQAEHRNNGGSTVRDAVDRIEAKVDALSQALTGLTVELARVDERARQHAATPHW